MKTIYLNQAIISYVEFMRKVIDMKNNPDDKTKALYHDFITYYRQMKNDNEIKDGVNDVRFGTCMETNLIKIYYINMPQLWAFLHLVLESKMNKELSLSFGYYKSDDFVSIKKELKGMWFVKKNMPCNSYVYLEDEKNKVDPDLKWYHTRLCAEQLKENAERNVKNLKVCRFKMEEIFNKRA
ncbi:MAG: hypothetical protein KIG83_10765 [Treponema sp.]|nr:hypothetical protein [Treponema sp.]